jgi:hypothetical protein
VRDQRFGAATSASRSGRYPSVSSWASSPSVSTEATTLSWTDGSGDEAPRLQD